MIVLKACVHHCQKRVHVSKMSCHLAVLAQVLFVIAVILCEWHTYKYVSDPHLHVCDHESLKQINPCMLRESGGGKESSSFRVR